MKLSMRFPEGKFKALTLSYDDGVEQDIELLRILDEHGIKCTFNLNSMYYEKDERTYIPGTIHRPMGLTRAKEVYTSALKNGHEVAVHGYAHPFLNHLPVPLATYDLIRDRERLESIFGGIIRGCAYPYGTYDDGAVEALKATGVVYARTVKSTLKFDIPQDWLRMPATCHHNDSALPALTEKFVLAQKARHQQPMLFYVWGHSYEFESDNNWDVIKKFCEAAGGKDDIWYANNIEIYDYIAAYEALQFSLRGNVVYNPTVTTLWFERDTKLYKIAPGETLTLA